MTLTRRQLLALLDEHGLRASRALGQNFMVDPNTARRMARLAAVGPTDHVIEIGAGLGALTLALRETGADVIAVEVDQRLVPVLRQIVEPAGATVIEGDAMTLDFGAVLRRHRGSWVLAANLPYNLATPLVARVLDEAPGIARLLVLVQREVGERLAAAPGSPAYGAVSVKVAYWATAKIVGRVGPNVFFPRPKVDSAIVAIERRVAPAVDPAYVPPDELFELVRTGFAQRRKMLRRSLAGVVGADAFEAAGVDSSKRAEDLDVAAWGRLAACRTLLRPR